MVEKLKAKGFDAWLDDQGWLRITYYTKHGEEKSVEIPSDVDCVRWMDNEIESFDESYATYIWLDEFGHGKNGAPYEMCDVLADQKEWTKAMKRIRKTIRG